MFARAVWSNATVCGFHFKIAKTQYQGSTWPAEFSDLDAINDDDNTPYGQLNCKTNYSAPDNKTCEFIMHKDNAYARVTDNLKYKTGKYQFYV